jgi:phosphatidylserine decarboxylase
MGATMLLDYLLSLPQYLIPQHLLSRAMYRLTRVRWRPAKNWLIHLFVWHYRVDMSSAVESDTTAYEDFNSFFTRALKPGVRPIVEDENAIACPVDGYISQIGEIRAGKIFQAKGHLFPLESLLSGSAHWADAFRGGAFVTLYLSPRDYHRVHMPLTGRLSETVYIPGRLFSVNPRTTRVVPRLFARNERVVTVFETPAGPMAIVLVGAIFVASIETVCEGVITPSKRAELRLWNYPHGTGQAPKLERGIEMGQFNMGSTVILLFGRHRVTWLASARPERKVQVGEPLGRVLS